MVRSVMIFLSDANGDVTPSAAPRRVFAATPLAQSAASFRASGSLVTG
jgi:hypothetical protein